MQGVTFWLLCDAVDEWSEQLCDAEFQLGGAGARLIGGVPELQRRARLKGWIVSVNGGSARCPDHAKLQVRRASSPDVTSVDLTSEQPQLDVEAAPEPERAPDDAWLTTADVAKWIGVSIKTVLRWRRAGTLPDPESKQGQTWTWRASTIDEWFKSKLHEATQ